MDDLYERNNQLREENSKLKNEVEGWKAADKRSVIYLVSFGIFFFLPIGMVIGRFFWSN